MNKFLIVLLVAVTIIQNTNAQTDSEQIKTIALNYIEGWYGADTARMNAALAESLAKRGFMLSHKTNELQIAEATKIQMVQWTSQKPNELEKNPNIKIEIDIIEIGQNIAMVKTITPNFIDYIHMGKYNNEWKIYNVIWEPNPDFKPNHKN